MLKIVEDGTQVSIHDILMGQVFTGSISFHPDFLFKKISINGETMIISLAGSNDTEPGIDETWPDPPIENYKPVEFEYTKD